MSRISSQPIETLGGAGLVVPLPVSTPWDFSDWMEIEASMPTRGAIAGIAVSGDPVGTDIEFHVGVGPEGAEANVGGHFRVSASSLAHGGNFDILLPTPINVLAVGDRVSVQARGSNEAFNPKVTLLYYPSPAFTELTTMRISSAPRGVDSPSIALTGVAWDWSDWQELTAGETNAIGVYGLACGSSTATDDVVYEVQIGTGAPGSELPTLGTHKVSAPIFWEHILFTVAHQVAANTRVAYRVRSNGTTTNTMSGALLFYERVTEPTSVGRGVIGPHIWIKKSRRQPGT